MAAVEHVDAELAGDVEQHAAADHRLDGVDAVVGEPAPPPGLDRIGAAVEPAVERDVGERVDVGADVGAHRDHVVGGARPVVAGHVAVAARERVPEVRVVGRLRHPDPVLPAEVEDAEAAAHHVQQGVGHRIVPSSRIRSIWSWS